jgi:hypothetical protein
VAVFDREWPALAEHEALGIASVAVHAACVSCGRLQADEGWRLDHSHILMLHGRTQIGAVGSWKKLGLPRFDEIGDTVGPSYAVFPTVKRRRFQQMFQNMSGGNLETLIRNAMGLPANLWPYGLRPEAWGAPIVIHHGLAVKFARKRDRPHLFLVSYTADAVMYPTEVWLGTHRGKPRLRFLKKLSVFGVVNNLLVCADPRTSIVVTSYVVAPHSLDASREGELLHASWASPPARLE